MPLKLYIIIGVRGVNIPRQMHIDLKDRVALEADSRFIIILVGNRTKKEVFFFRIISSFRSNLKLSTRRHHGTTLGARSLVGASEEWTVIIRQPFSLRRTKGRPTPFLSTMIRRPHLETFGILFREVLFLLRKNDKR